MILKYSTKTFLIVHRFYNGTLNRANNIQKKLAKCLREQAHFSVF